MGRSVNHATPLLKPLRSQLENTVKSARDVAEKAAKVANAASSPTTPPRHCQNEP